MYAKAANDRPNPVNERTEEKPVDRFIFQNSVVTLEDGTAGIIAKINRGYEVDYVGPLPSKTVRSIKEVGEIWE